MTAWQGNHISRRVCIFITLDVKNAFNSANWQDIIRAIEDKIDGKHDIKRVIDDYLQNRKLLYETNQGTCIAKITAGVPQGSILGPDLWNFNYDELLLLEMPEDTKLEGFADDVAAIIIARNEDQARRKITIPLHRINEWMKAHGLELAKEKTEMVVLTRQRWFPSPFQAKILDQNIMAQNTVRYLGATIDAKLTFFEHIKRAANKADQVITTLARLMPNIAGPRSSKRRVLMSVKESIMLYAAEVWADTLSAAKYRQKLARVQRKGALRIASAYRTILEASIMVIAGVLPIDILAKERKRIYNHQASKENLIRIKKLERNSSMEEWQQRWLDEKTGRWTAKLIKDVQPWKDRDHGEIDYYMTQFLSGHG